MRQAFRTIAVATRGPGLYEITEAARDFVAAEAMSDGLLTCFIRHTSASLLIQENADPDVRRDLQDFFARLARKGMEYRHDAEGPDDMPSHIRSALTQTSIGIPLHAGQLALGTWQGLYVFEHRRAAPPRCGDADNGRVVPLVIPGEHRGISRDVREGDPSVCHNADSKTGMSFAKPFILKCLGPLPLALLLQCEAGDDRGAYPSPAFSANVFSDASGRAP